jgi:sec-independent protein translocase protein TatC
MSAQKKKEMTFFDHLAEFRTHLIRMMIALVLCAGGSLAFSPYVLKFLVQPYGDLLIVIGPTESFSIYVRIALISGFMIAMPYIFL